jgi:hypothetical protein
MNSIDKMKPSKSFINNKIVINNPSLVIKAYDKKYLLPESKYIFNFLSKNIKDFNDLLRNKIYEMTDKDLHNYLKKLLGTKRLIKIVKEKPSIFSLTSDKYKLYLPDDKKKIKIYIKLRDYINFMRERYDINISRFMSKDSVFIIQQIIYVYALKTMEALQEDLVGNK